MGGIMSIFNVNVPVDVGNLQLQLSKSDLQEQVDGGFVYLKAKSMMNKEIKECVDNGITFEYSCDSKKCNLGPVLTEMAKSADLKRIGIKEMSLTVVRTIDENQELFTTRSVGGYVLQSMGIPYLFIKNKDKDLAAKPDTPVGFADLTEMRRHLIQQSQRHQMTGAINFQSVQAAVTGLALGATFAALYVIKKIR
jgi:hypothetical protein